MQFVMAMMPLVQGNPALQGQFDAVMAKVMPGGAGGLASMFMGGMGPR